MIKRNSVSEPVPKTFNRSAWLYCSYPGRFAKWRKPPRDQSIIIQRTPQNIQNTLYAYKSPLCMHSYRKREYKSNISTLYVNEDTAGTWFQIILLRYSLLDRLSDRIIYFVEVSWWFIVKHCEVPLRPHTTKRNHGHITISNVNIFHDTIKLVYYKFSFCHVVVVVAIVVGAVVFQNVNKKRQRPRS